jgi:hypothetical protein
MASQRLHSGADCPWTLSADGPDLYCRKSGRLFRLKEEKRARPPMPRFEVTELTTMSDKRGSRVGQYRSRAEATKAVADVAFSQP